jgi:hypothetical protein
VLLMTFVIATNVAAFSIGLCHAARDRRHDG